MFCDQISFYMTTNKISLLLFITHFQHFSDHRIPVTGVNTLKFLQPLNPNQSFLHGFSLPIQPTRSPSPSKERWRHGFRDTPMDYRNSITLRFLILHSFSSGFASSRHFRFLCPKPRFSSITLQNRLHRLVFYFSSSSQFCEI